MKDIDNFPFVTYTPPQGSFVVAKRENAVIGWAAIKHFHKNSYELKRM